MIGAALRLIDGLVRQALSGTPGPTDNFWYSDSVGQRTTAGVNISEENALTFSACWACTRLLCASESMIPFNVYKREPDGGKSVDWEHPAQRIIHDQPNPEMSAMAWRSAGMNHQVNWGNAVSELVRDQLGRPAELWPIHPSRVKYMRDRATNALFYRVHVDDTSAKADFVDLKPSEVFHVPSIITDDGIIGKGVIRYARESIGVAKAEEQYGASFYGEGARPSVVLTHPAKLSPEARGNLRREWNEIHQGAKNAHKVAILYEGMTLKDFGFSPEDAQFIEQQNFSAETIARFYGVPPHLIGLLDRATWANAEEMGIVYVIYSLVPWLKLWEHEAWRKLFTKAEQKSHYAKHLVDALLRGNTEARTRALQQQFFNGALNLDEWRSIEDRGPLPDGLGQRHFVQSAMIPLDALVKQADAGTLPPGGAPPPDTDDDGGEDQPGTMPANPNPAGEPSGASQPRLAAQLLRPMLTDVFNRMLHRETTDMLKAAGKPGEFLSWLDAFYTRHQAAMTEALAAAEESWKAAGYSAWREGVAVRWVDRSRAALLDSAGEAKADELAAVIEGLAARWKGRPAEAVEEIFGKAA